MWGKRSLLDAPRPGSVPKDEGPRVGGGPGRAERRRLARLVTLLGLGFCGARGWGGPRFISIEGLKVMRMESGCDCCRMDGCSPGGGLDQEYRVLGQPQGKVG